MRRLLVVVTLLAAWSVSAQPCQDAAGILVTAVAECPAPACVAGTTMRINLELRDWCLIGFCSPVPAEPPPCGKLHWDLGDGTTVVTSAKSYIVHTYDKPGSYSLTIRNDRGAVLGFGAAFVATKPLAYIRLAPTRLPLFESAAGATFQLLRNGDLTRPIAVRYQYASGSNADIGTVTMEPGETAKSFAVAFPNDSVYTGPRRHTIMVDAVRPGDALFPYVTWISSHDIHLLEVIDDDPAPRFSMGDDIHIVEGDEGEREAFIDVTVTPPLTRDTFVGMQVTPSTPADLVAAPGVILPANVSSARLRITIRGDREGEADEAFTIEPNGAVSEYPFTIAKRSARVVIINDDLGFIGDNHRAAAGSRLTLKLRVPNVDTPQTIALSSSNASVVEVAASATAESGSSLTTFDVRARRRGAATITARIGNKTAETRIVVHDVVTPSFDHPSIELVAGTSTAVRLDALPLVSWPLFAHMTSSDPEVAAVTSPVEITGGTTELRIEGRNPGSALITVTLPPQAGGATAVLQVTVHPARTRRRPAG